MENNNKEHIVQISENAEGELTVLTNYHKIYWQTGSNKWCEAVTPDFETRKNIIKQKIQP